jgi:hypothetical protein
MARKLTGLCFALLFAALWIGLLDTTTLFGLGRLSPRLAITELMALNESTLVDEDGDPSDWIEIHNPEARDVDLDGWYLTDNRRDLTRWRFPSARVAAGDYLLVYASGKDRAVAGAELHTNFALDSGGETLALVHPDGKTVASEFTYTGIVQFRDVSYGLDGAGNERYFTAATPGAINRQEPGDLGPIIRAARHTPSLPTASEPLGVTAEVRGSFAPVRAVTLHYRVAYEDLVALPMLDDGESGDGAAGDGLYGAVIPSHAYKPGDMVRYRFTAIDVQGGESRWPLYPDPAHSPEYLGTMIADPGVASLLPVLYWFTAEPASAEERVGTRASVYYDGVFYDNVFVRLRGYTSIGCPKKSLKFDFNPGYHFRFSLDSAPVEEFNLNAACSDRSYIRLPLAWETYRDAGAPYSISFPMRVQQNGAFYGTYRWVEQPGRQYLERQGLDPEGALYKMRSGSALTESGNNVAKRTRLDEGEEDLEDLIRGIHLSGEARTAYLFDHVNIPALINYQAAATVIHDRDHGYNNYYLYRDTEGTGEWMFLPWDKSLTFGLDPDRGPSLDLLADDDPESHPLRSYKYNDLIDALYDVPITREMFLRRLRTVMDELLQPPGTPVEERRYERRIDELFTRMQLDAALDTARWPNVEEWPEQPFAEAVRSLRTDYLDVRRVHLYRTHGADNGGIIPDAQPATASVRIGDVHYASPAEDPGGEFFSLVNDNPYAVDLSGWTVRGTIAYVFQPGVVLPSGGTLYVSPDVNAFRTRPRGPTGGEGRFVQGNYDGRLSGELGILRVHNAEGTLVTSRLFLDLR